MLITTQAELRAQSATLAAAHTLQQQQQQAYDWAQRELGEMRERERRGRAREVAMQSKLEELAAKTDGLLDSQKPKDIT